MVGRVNYTGVPNKAGMVLILRVPARCALGGCLPPATLDSRRVPGERGQTKTNGSNVRTHSVWFPTQASSPWKLLQLNADAATIKRVAVRVHIGEARIRMLLQYEVCTMYIYVCTAESI